MLSKSPSIAVNGIIAALQQLEADKMIFEVALMNCSAIALAADSALQSFIEGV